MTLASRAGKTSRTPWRAALVAVCALWLASCAHVNDLRCVTRPQRPGEDVEVTFLGVGGFLIRHGDVVIVTPPLYSNPGALSVGLHSIGTDATFVEERSRRHADALGKARLILVGHGHYDHLMDLAPLVEKRQMGQAWVYAGPTVQQSLAATDGRVQVIPTSAAGVDHAAAWDQPDAASHWLCLPSDPGEKPGFAGAAGCSPGSVARVLAIRSEHSPQFLSYRLYDNGAWPAPPAPPPPPLRDACAWRPGTTLAFLIDFLDQSGAVVFRIRYDDSSSLFPCGYVPKLLDGPAGTLPVDLALLTAGGAQSMGDYPVDLARSACVKDVLIGHWEDFFERYDPRTQKLSPVPGVRDVVLRARGLYPEACLPWPDSSYTYATGTHAPTCPPLDRVPERRCDCYE